MNKFRVKRTKEVTTIVEEYAYIYGDTFEEAVAKIKDNGYLSVDSFSGEIGSSVYKFGELILVEDEYEGFAQEDREFEIMTNEIHGLINKCITDEEIDAIEYDDVNDYIARKFFKTYSREIQMCQDNNCCLWGYKDDMISTGDGHYHSHCVKRCEACGNSVNKSELNDNGLCWRCEY